MKTNNEIKEKKQRSNYIARLKWLLLNRIPQLGEFSFEDNSWYFSRKHKDSLPKGCYTVTFHRVPERYRVWVKYYVLLCNSSISHTAKKCYKIADFLTFIEYVFPGIELEGIQREHVNKFEYHLSFSSDSMNTKQFTYAAVQDFFTKLTDFPEIPNVIPAKNINPFRQTKEGKSTQILNVKVLRRWDKVMKDEKLAIPLEFRTLYWLIRSFPNRVTEILSMKRDCLKTFYSEYTIQVPTFKQSGGYERAEIKTIPVIYTGHGKYVIDLVKQLQSQTQELLANWPVESTTKADYLFVIRRWNFFNDNGNLNFRFNKVRPKLANWTGPKINELFAQLARIINIQNEDGSICAPTTHEFRHRAVTDRLYIVGYTTEQIRKLTGHKNETMTKHYTHQLVEEHKKIHLNISGLRQAKDCPVEFQGKVLNLDERTVQQLNKDPRRYLTWEVNGKKGVGICSDISGCNPKGTSVHFECYACDWFVPKLEYYEDYKQEHSYWQNVINRTANNPSRAAHFENAVRNASYLERILLICEQGIEQFNESEIKELVSANQDRYIWE